MVYSDRTRQRQNDRVKHNALDLGHLLERPHTTRFPSCDGSHRTRYATTGRRRGSWQMTAIPSDCLES